MNIQGFIKLSTDREVQGRAYMDIALQYGHVELLPGHELNAAVYIKKLAPDFPVDDTEFYFSHGKYLYDCYGECNILDYIEGAQEEKENGFVLPISYTGTALK